MMGFASVGTAVAVVEQARHAGTATDRVGRELAFPPAEPPFWDPKPTQILTVGYLHTFRPDPTGYGNGVEVTYVRMPFYESLVGVGAYAQLQSVSSDGRVNLSVGPQLNYAFFGVEAGYEYLASGQGQATSHGVHLAPFISAGGLVSVAWHAVLPFAHSGSGERPNFQHALALAIKLPIPLALNIGHGRPLRHEGETHLAQTKPSGDWQPQTVPALAVPSRALGALWLQRALTEHASIATFAELTLELLALGAPAELLQAAQRAQADELRHALSCFGVAKALLERQIGPGDFPAAARGARGRTHSELAVESLRDGLLGEGFAAELARTSLGRVAAELKSVFEAIAREEADHAELGFQVLEWCLKTGGFTVRAAVSAALNELPSWWPEVDGDALEPLSPEDAEAHGVLPVVERARIFLAVRTRVQTRVATLLGGVTLALS